MVRILTLNINGPGTRHGPWDRRRGLIAEALRSADADLVALQAVRRDPTVAGGLDQAAELAQMLQGYSYCVFRPATHYDTGAADGMAILSRQPAIHLDAIPLTRRPGLEDNFDRVLLCARFSLGVEILHLVNAHFSWVEEQAEDNVREAFPLMQSLAGPAVLVGDFNSTPDSNPMQTLCREGWVDVWAQLHPDKPGWTFESNAPTKRIDYVWANRALRQHVDQVRIVADGADGDVRPSDHFGLLASVELAQK